jgi:hypothetical protein
MRSFVVHL